MAWHAQGHWNKHLRDQRIKESEPRVFDGQSARLSGKPLSEQPPLRWSPSLACINLAGNIEESRLPRYHASNTSLDHATRWGYMLHEIGKRTMYGIGLQAERWIAERSGKTSWRQAQQECPELLEQLRCCASAAASWLSIAPDQVGYLWPSDPSTLESLKLHKALPAPEFPRQRLTRMADDLLANLRSGHGVQPRDLEPWGHALLLGPAHEHARALGGPFSAWAESKRPLDQRAIDEAMELRWCFEMPEVQEFEAREVEQLRSQRIAMANYRLDRITQGSKPSLSNIRADVDRSSRQKDPGLMRAIDQGGDQLLAALMGGEKLSENKRRMAQAAQQTITAWQRLRTTCTELRPTLMRLALELDPGVANRLGVRVAALRLDGGLQGGDANPVGGQIIVNLGPNPETAQLERIFLLLALKVALGHPWRGIGKDQKLWSLACDLALMPFLDAMKVGAPHPGEPRDARLEALGSAEAIYAALLEEGTGRLESLGTEDGNVLDGSRRSQEPGENEAASAMSEDEETEWLEALRQGLDQRESLRQGLMPGNLLRLLQDRAAPAPPWRPALTHHAQGWFPTLEKKRSYLRPSRRTRSAREPRPARIHPPEAGYALLVLMDTSGSVEDEVIEEALGGVRTMCGNLDITRLRIISCDAAAHDHGWQKPWLAGQHLDLRGGGGTSLQVGLDLIEKANDIPADTPLLIITDGIFWEKLDPGRREHAYLMPPRSKLPFHTSAPVFTVGRSKR